MQKEVEKILGHKFNNKPTIKKCETISANPCKWIIDSGAGFHLVGRKRLASNGVEVKEAAKPLILSTANGRVGADKVAVVEVEKLGTEAEAIVLDDSPSVISLGRKCVEEGWS